MRSSPVVDTHSLEFHHDCMICDVFHLRNPSLLEMTDPTDMTFVSAVSS